MERFEFLRTLTKSIPDYQVRNAIANDVTTKIEEAIPAYEKKGMTKRQAERKAIAIMGKPDDVLENYLQKYKPGNEFKNILFYFLFSSLGFLAMWGFTQNGLFEDSIINTLFSACGYLLMIYTVVTGMHGNMSFPFKNRNGGYPFNSYALCAAATALVVRNYAQWLIWTVLLGVILCVERIFSKKKQMKLVEAYLWKTGEVVADIEYRGKVKIGSNVEKAKSIAGDIPTGTKIVVVNVDGSCLVVKPIK